MKKLLVLTFFTLSSSLFILKAQPGYIYTVAGYGVYGYNGDGGPATTAELSVLTGVGVDRAGRNFYIADNNNIRLRQVVVSTGIITTIAGTGMAGYSGDGGPATAAEISNPFSVRLDDSNNIYFVDSYNYRIRKINASNGIINTLLGNGVAGYYGDGGPATLAEINAAQGVAIDTSGNIYITDASNRRIRKVTVATGIVTTIAGNGVYGFSGDGGPATAAELASPYGIAVDDSGNVYYVDTDGDKVRKINTLGIISTYAGNGQGGYSGDGGQADLAELYSPTGMSVDDSGNIYIADYLNATIRMVTRSTGIITSVAGHGVAGFFGDGGPATAAKMYQVYDVDVDSAGDFYIADDGNQRIRKVNHLNITTNIKNLENLLSDDIYPNPATNNIFVTLSSNPKESLCQLYTITGQQVWNSTIAANISTFEIPVDNLNSGIYFLKLETGDGTTFTKKVEVLK
jgi:hypothetical protein